jgi:glycosyltransferase involved in cell wall biosynthesis
MRILFVADGRSPIALNWISYYLDRGDEVHLASTFDCAPSQEFASLRIIPVAFSQLKKAEKPNTNQNAKPGIFWGSSYVNFRTSIRRILAALSIPGAAKQLEEIMTQLKPDLVHALRIPFEGILAAEAMQNDERTRLIISVWRNDYTLHAGATPWMRRYTRLALTRADGLHTDCRRDLRLAYQWGFSEQKTTLVVPGNGGINIDLFYPQGDGIKSQEKIVINPRGFRSYIRNDTFFEAIPQILDDQQEIKFVCPGMAGEAEVQKWIDKYEIERAVELLPNQSREKMATLFRHAAVAVSPSTHDGTPNTLLEAMASGCYPVAGDLDSIREWIEPGLNGSLIDPADSIALAEAVTDALRNPALRQEAADINQKIITERAEYQSSMARAVDFYKMVSGI